MSSIIEKLFKVKKKVVLNRPGVSRPWPSPTHLVRRHLSAPLFLPRNPGSVSRSAQPPSDIELMLREYQRAREEAKVEIARARDRLREQTEQEKQRIRQQIISQLQRVGNRFQGRPGAWRQTSDGCLHWAATGMGCTI